MKPLFVGFILMVLICTVGIASAVEPPSVTQTINGEVQPYTITITGPGEITDWDLVRGINNEKDVGPVYISTSAPSTYDMVLTVSGNYDRLHSDALSPLDNNMFISGLAPPVPEATGWQALTTGSLTLATIDATTTPTAVPVRLRQFISVDDDDGDYSIILTYTLSVTPPTP